MKQSRPVIALTLLAAFASDSWGQSKQPPAQSKQSAQPPASDQRGTEQVPLAVKILPAQDAKEKADKEDHERQEKGKVDEKLAFETQRIADYTDRLALFTIFLFCVAVLQAGLFLWQLRYMRQGMRDTEVAAKAARDSAEATKESVALAKDTAQRQLRAYISVEIRGFQFDRDPNLALVCKANFEIRNDGQTPAYDVRTNVDFRIAAQPLLSDFTRPNDNILRFENSISPNRTQEASGTKAFSIEKQKLLPGQKLYFLGLILYKDAFGIERETWFCGYIDQSEFVMDSTPGTKTSPITFHWAERHNKTT